MSELVRAASVLETGANLSETALDIPEDLSEERWLELGEGLRRIGRGYQWWIGDWLAAGEAQYGATYEMAERITGLDQPSLRLFKSIAERVPNVNRLTTLSWTHHAQVAPLPIEEQAAWLKRAEADGLSKRELAKAIKKESVREVGSVAGTYRVIYADPPWQYGDQLIEGYGAAEHHYPTLSTSELCDLRVREKSVPDLADENSVLFLWATSPLLIDALQVIEAWGFFYKASFVWDKVKHNFGHYNSVRHEFLLIATRGSCTPQAEKLELHDSVVSIERTEHSAKPEEFRAIIEGLYPHGPRLELFARADSIPGWDLWGAV